MLDLSGKIPTMEQAGLWWGKPAVEGVPTPEKQLYWILRGAFQP